jgi:hypothetical protein
MQNIGGDIVANIMHVVKGLISFMTTGITASTLHVTKRVIVSFMRNIEITAMKNVWMTVEKNIVITVTTDKISLTQFH